MATLARSATVTQLKPVLGSYVFAQPRPPESADDPDAPEPRRVSFADGSVMSRLRSPWGGIAGPGMFITAWLLAGAIEPGYSPAHDAISRLAAVGSTVRPLMTAGFVAFAFGMLLYSGALRAAVSGPASTAVVATSVATFGVMALPLGVNSKIDDIHGAFAIVAYATLVATPLLAARPLVVRGRRGVARLSVATGVVAGLCLAGTLLGAVPGLLQRVGLTLVDAWIAGSAVWILRRRSGGAGWAGPGSAFRRFVR